MTMKDIIYFTYVPKQNHKKLLEMLKQGEQENMLCSKFDSNWASGYWESSKSWNYIPL